MAGHRPNGPGLTRSQSQGRNERMSTENHTPYPVGTIVVRRAGGDRFRVIDQPEWMTKSAVRTVNLATGAEGSKSIAALDKFYTVEVAS